MCRPPLDSTCIFIAKGMLRTTADALRVVREPLVSLTSYADMGQPYRRLVAWMFGDGRVLAMVADTKKEIRFM